MQSRGSLSLGGSTLTAAITLTFGSPSLNDASRERYGCVSSCWTFCRPLATWTWRVWLSGLWAAAPGMTKRNNKNQFKYTATPSRPGLAARPARAQVLRSRVAVGPVAGRGSGSRVPGPRPPRAVASPSIIASGGAAVYGAWLVGPVMVETFALAAAPLTCSQTACLELLVKGVQLLSRRWRRPSAARFRELCL